MAILPYHDKLLDQGTYTESQLAWIAFCQYLETAIVIAVSIFYSINVWCILLKQKKFEVVPLMVFYILALPLICLRFYYAIWFF